MDKTKYVLVDMDTHEIWTNNYGGELPPMTKQEILHYFWDKTWEQISSEYHIKYYPCDDTHKCPHCGTLLNRSETQGYKWQCFYCDEDFCDFETKDENKDSNTRKDYKQFYEDACELYFKHRDHHQTEDWEQEYFDDMDSRYDTETEQCLIHLFYADDDDNGTVSQGIIDDLVGKTLLCATSFDDTETDTTVVACIVKK